MGMGVMVLGEFELTDLSDPDIRFEADGGGNFRIDVHV